MELASNVHNTRESKVKTESNVDQIHARIERKYVPTVLVKLVTITNEPKMTKKNVDQINVLKDISFFKTVPVRSVMITTSLRTIKEIVEKMSALQDKGLSSMVLVKIVLTSREDKKMSLLLCLQHRITSEFVLETSVLIGKRSSGMEHVSRVVIMIEHRMTRKNAVQTIAVI